MLSANPILAGRPDYALAAVPFPGMVAIRAHGASVVLDALHAANITARETAGIALATFILVSLAALTFAVCRRYSAQNKELRSAEQRYRLLFERSLAGVIRTTLDGRILECNSASAHIFGFASCEALMASPATDRYNDPKDRRTFVAILQKVKQLSNYEQCLRRKDGSKVSLFGSASLVEGKAGAPAVCEETFVDITERKHAEEIFHKAFDANPEPITIATVSEGRYIDVNESFLRNTGYRREEVLGHTSLDLKFWKRLEDRAKFIELLRKQGSVRDWEITYCTKSGEERIASNSSELIDIAGQECVMAILRDITEQKSLERQLRQTQKMEAVGQLSGGIAHDFNNLLGVIIGYCEVLETRLPPDDPSRRECLQIKKAGQSAASLTRQLLAFSRQQVLEPRVLDLNSIVSNVEKMLRRLIGADIELKTSLAPSLGNIKADQTQIEQVILNLAVNARDAMPQGGKLMIATSNFDLDEDYARRHPPQLPGSYVLLTVADNGTGMDAETQARIFEPFFTTKEVGRGTGLGLSTVYGVVRQSGGHIWVYSELGQGTTFKIYLPRAGQPARAEKPAADQANSLRGAETVLLVEDEEALRELTRSMLEGNGYTVLEADRPEAAIEIAGQHEGPIHVLLSDMVMPGMNGQVLATKLTQVKPDMKVVYMSGYTGFTHPGLADSEGFFLPKPFTRDALLHKLHEALNSELKLESK